MCLYTRTNIPTISSEDIVCYKLILFCNGIHYTPWRLHPVIPIGIIEEPENVELIMEKSRIGDICKIEAGYIHSFKDVPKLLLPILRSPDRYQLYKCIIPAGTPYFEGNNALGAGCAGEYASKMI